MEWRNVVKGRPLYPGHYQPHLPADLGFYDLRLPEVRAAQADLAREHGIHGFCYYHFWFNGRRFLDRPFREVLASGKPDFPFFLCWANENLTRAWDGLDRDILLKQEYGAEDDRAHIRSLLPAFKDPRYMRIDGKPLFMVYRTELLPDPGQTAEIWREEADKAGIGEICLAKMEGLHPKGTPESTGFDCAVEFAPDWRESGPRLMEDAVPDNKVYSYDNIMRNMLNKPEPPYRRYRCVMPSWDNTARRKTAAAIYDGATPEKYQAWLEALIDQLPDTRPDDERIIFINAWNEWAEGCHLEPCEKWGRGYLEATRKALERPHG
jgi:lipopolysaccharide biosynthesis protein